MLIKSIMKCGITLLLFSGCNIADFSASTTATYQINPDGTKIISYSSNKEQQGLELDLDESDGHIKILRIKVDKATTVADAILATREVNFTILNTLRELTAAAKAGAMSGS